MKENIILCLNFLWNKDIVSFHIFPKYTKLRRNTYESIVVTMKYNIDNYKA